MINVYRYAGILLCLSGFSQTLAEPFVPSDDQQVLERLPASLSAQNRAVRQLRRAWEQQPNDLDAALALARRYLDIGRAESDPRYYGYIEAVLQAWWEQAQPPPQALLLRAAVRQFRHQFDLALADLEQVLQAQPRNAQAWLMRAVNLRVQGRYREAMRSCAPLSRLTQRVIASACMAASAALSGQARQSYQLLLRHLPRVGEVPLRLWLLTLLADTAVQLGDSEAAERHFRQALDLGQRDVYLLSAYADFLLDRDRPDAVRELLRDDTRPDALLLRLTLAEQRLAAPEWHGHLRDLQARFDAVEQRGGAAHLGGAARFTLELLNDPVEALRLALANWERQREPSDSRLVLEAALAAKQPEAARQVLEWLRQTGLEDVRLAALARRLEGL